MLMMISNKHDADDGKHWRSGNALLIITECERGGNNTDRENEVQRVEMIYAKPHGIMECLDLKKKKKK